MIFLKNNFLEKWICLISDGNFLNFFVFNVYVVDLRSYF